VSRVIILPNGNLGTGDYSKGSSNSPNVASALESHAQVGQYVQGHNSSQLSCISFLGSHDGAEPVHYHIRPKDSWVVARAGNKFGNLSDFLKSTASIAGRQVDGDTVIAALAQLVINVDESGGKIALAETPNPETESADNALVLANRVVGDAKSVGKDLAEDDSRRKILTPTPAIPIRSLESNDWHIYIITSSGAAAKTVGQVITHKDFRRESKRGFPRFAYLPAELRSKIVSPILISSFFRDAPPMALAIATRAASHRSRPTLSVKRG
jgi:hypothetical protein